MCLNVCGSIIYTPKNIIFYTNTILLATYTTTLKIKTGTTSCVDWGDSVLVRCLFCSCLNFNMLLKL